MATSNAEATDDQGETYAFRLFAAPASSSVTAKSKDPKSGSSNRHAPLHPTPTEQRDNPKTQAQPRPPNAPEAQSQPQPQSQTQTQQIRLPTPSPPPDDPSHANKGKGRDIAPERPLSYYLAPQPAPAQKAAFAKAAVSGSAVLAQSARPCPGLYLPWRVISIAASDDRSSDASRTSGSQTSPLSSKIEGGGGGRGKRTRLGKKARLKMRVKMRARRAAEREKEDAVRAKEEKIKERNRKRNREKQLKKREKGREAKLKVEGEVGAVEG